jgi:spore coat protein U-like protein
MRSRRNLCALFGVLIVAAMTALTTRAQAHTNCTFTITNVDFGNIDLSANTTFDTTATLTANCSGGNQGDLMRICPNLNAGGGGTTTGDPRFMKSGANTLNFNLYQNSSRTTVWGSYLWAFPSFTSPTIDLTLGPGGNASTTATIYARVSAGQQTLPPGTYTSSFNGGGNVQIAYDTTTDNCTKIGNKNATNANFTVSATYLATCMVSATSLNFGSTGSLSSNIDATNTVTATCSSTTAYNIGLSAGNGTGATVATRKMTSGANTVSYSLYTSAARSVVWGNTVGTDTVSGSGSGLGQSYTVYGRVPSQTVPPPATYSDTIVVTVTY